MPRFKNVSGDELHMQHAEGPTVGSGDVVQVDGEITGELADAWLVGEGDQARAWPKVTWELVDKPPAKNDKADRPGKENG